MTTPFAERALWVRCGGDHLPAILHGGRNGVTVGVLMIVGGRQYRVGSGRSFVLAARDLAQHGIPVLRFDARGMGDSDGSPREFTELLPDIQAAINTLQEEVPALSGVVLWGLCDAASAGLLYWESTRDPRILAMVLLNPWVRSAQTLARTRLRHHYRIRLRDPQFWVRVIEGKVRLQSILGWLSDWRKARQLRRSALGFQARMGVAWMQFPGPITTVLSQRDETALEFQEAASTLEEWRGALEREARCCIWLEEADHTFSSRGDRDAVVDATLRLLQRVGSAEPASSWHARQTP